MAETIYVKGLRVFSPHDNAPDFVKGTLIIGLNELVQFCKDNPDYLSDYKGVKQLKCQILEGKSGLYFTVDTYRKKDDPKADNEDSPDSLPF